ncbi:FMN-binding protein [Calycomorphotria hydatis]|uniref:Electron transport complex subunit RsxG n=1 Tax=Calycomorphotria hydatis TaxID=2528027 RepID=A0A517TBL7_9PLAN|nr:FMN-binding protein [Calycomorphotria hydatis]QDT65765.1 Electron transport complex subunit RsxG [Calycomorphotria hydatis]
MRSPGWRQWLVHLCRWGLVCLIVVLIRLQHVESQNLARGTREITAPLSQIAATLLNADSFGPGDETRGGLSVLDPSGAAIGYVVQTTPRSDHIIGYVGPNDLLLIFDDQLRLQKIELISSGDTADHVKLIREQPNFFEQFERYTWDELGELNQNNQVEAVSGATLTSLAMLEGMVYRVSGHQPSLRFPQSPDIDDVVSQFPDVAELILDENKPGVFQVVDESDQRLGYVLRSSPESDQRIGYQGPTDGLLFLDAEGEKVKGIGIHETYETPLYAEDVTLDWTFMHSFDGMPVEEFAKLDLIEDTIEGVSGATMTSQVLAENLILAAQRYVAPTETVEPPSWFDRFSVGVHDIGTLIVILFAWLMCFTNLRGVDWLRVSFQCVLIVYLGFVCGNLLSQGLFVGWARNGVPFTNAIGLVALCVSAFVVPLFTKKQIYCHHLCPHGAAQELLKNRLKWKWRLRPNMRRALNLIVPLLFVWVVLVAMIPLAFDLANIEPFDAYVWWAAGIPTIAIAVVGLVMSMFVPMAYCRFGCPTGSLLDYLRRTSRSDQLTWRDAGAVCLLALAFVLWWF